MSPDPHEGNYYSIQAVGLSPILNQIQSQDICNRSFPPQPLPEKLLFSFFITR
jgi:hypothetical protein